MALVPPPKSLMAMERPQPQINFAPQFEHHITFKKEAEMIEEFRIQYDLVKTGMPMTAFERPPTVYRTLNLRFINEPTWEGLLEKHKNNVPLDISAEKWMPSASGSLSIDATESGSVTLKCTFGDVDKWCYPRLTVPDGIDLTQYSGVILRARAWGETTPRFFLHERDTGTG